MDLQELIAGLSDPAAFPEGGAEVEVVQTHISAVFLTGDRAYKVKKPIVLWGFLDYGTVEKRRVMCEEEVRLNRRMAPGVYLGVLPVVRRDGRLRVGGTGEVVDHAVVMRRLPAGATLKERIQSGAATVGDLADLGRALARFHAAADRGLSVAREGRPVVFARVLARNFRSTKASVPDVFPEALRDWVGRRTAALLRAHRGTLARRARTGGIVEGHGDLRAEHAVLLEGPGGPQWGVIDAIEFTTMLRAIDPLSDVAFLAMELTYLGRKELADALLAAYSAEAPDPDAEALLPFYLAYRAHVRAMVDAIRSRGTEIPAAEREAAVVGARLHYALFWAFARQGTPPPLLVMTGPSGVGKSRVARTLARFLAADVVSSDVVRKRLAGVATTERVAGARQEALYSTSMSQRTYAAMLEEGERALLAGRVAILDATFLRRADRADALALARRLRVPFALVAVTAPEPVVRKRIEARAAAGKDPSDATFDVYLSQVKEAEPLTPEEASLAVRHDGSSPPADLLMSLLSRLVSPPAPR